MSLELLRRFAAAGEVPDPLDAEPLAFVELARAHGLVAQLDEAVGPGAGWPEPARLALRDAHRSALARGARLFEHARRVLARLRGAGLRVLPMKGLALTGDVYASPAQRPMLDLDVLVLEDWDSALALLERDAYRVSDRAEHAWALEDSEGVFVLELHRGLSSCPSLHPVDADGAWSRRVVGSDFDRPSPEDLLVQLAVHAAFQHGLRLRLGQYLDFRRLLVARAPGAALTLEIARRQRAEACLYAALAAAETLVAAPLPEELRSALEEKASRRLRRRVAAIRVDPLALLAPSPLRELAGWRFALAGMRGLELVARSLRPRDGSASSGARRGARLLRELLD